MNKIQRFLSASMMMLCGYLLLPHQAAGQTFTVANPMSEARKEHTATLLTNGQILVVAGYNTVGFAGGLASVELFSPATGTWTNIVSIPTGGSYGHTATLLPNGKVLIAGGYLQTNGGVITPSLVSYLYNPTNVAQPWTGRFMSYSHHHHTATLLQDGTVLIAGIGGGSELYNPNTGTWATTPGAGGQRDSHTATLLPNGQVLVAGGGDGTAELYNPITGLWTPTGTMNSPRMAHTATLLPSGKVLVAGGYADSNDATMPTNTAELYNPATGTWTSTGSMTYRRGHHTATLLPDGKVFVSGGWNLGFITYGETYNPATGTWTTNAAYSPARYGSTATLLPNGKIFFVGGSSGAAGVTAESQGLSPLSSADLYQPYVAQALAVNLDKYVSLSSSSLIAGTNYQIQISSDSTNWISTNAPFTAVSSTWSATNFWRIADWTHLFFRLQQQ
ncbi:MAG: hypothetical protein RLZZ350_2302 [Verrucomicrobiota bacterium]|jgi:WD40 repeat protein